MSHRRSTTPFSKRAGVRLGSAAFAAGLVGAGLMATSASAQSDPLTYACNFGNPVGTESITAQFDTNAPKKATDGKDFPVTEVNGTITLPATVVAALAKEGYTSMSGQAVLTLKTQVTGGGKGAEDKAEIPLAFEGVEIPDSGELTFEVSRTLKDGSAYAYGTDQLTFEAGDLNLEAASDTDVDGNGELDSSSVDCDLAPASQDSTIDTVQIVDGDTGGDGGNNDGGNNDGGNGGNADDGANKSDGGGSDDGGQSDDDSDVPTVIDAGV